MPRPDAQNGELFVGKATGFCDPLTEKEIKTWRQREWILPIGRFASRTLHFGGKQPVTLRTDAAAAWEQIVLLADRRGSTLRGEYGDSARPVRPASTGGAYRYSFHYAGRAIDIPLEHLKGSNQRYFVISDPIAGQQFWRIYCRTIVQDGSKGSLVKNGALTHYLFTQGIEAPLPEGYYVDLTALIQSTGTFERVKSQGGWKKNYNLVQWWHFQYKRDAQLTFLDEMELFGFSETHLRKSGWPTDEMLDHAPGE
jgi:hypothetical protein